MRNLSIIVSIVLFFGLASCKANLQKPVAIPENPNNGIKEVQGDLKAATTQLADTTKSIKELATEGKKNTPPAAATVLTPYWDGIWFKADKQELIIASLQRSNQDLDVTKTKVDKLTEFSQGETTRADAEKTRADKAEASLADALTKKLHLLIVFGVVGVAGGVALILSGYKSGWIVGGGSIALVAASIITSFAAKAAEVVMPYVLGGVGLTVIGFVVWYFINRKKEVVQAQQVVNKLKLATVELLKTNETAKQLMTDSNRKRMFGDGVLPGMASVIQSHETQKLVSELRKTIKQAPPIAGSVEGLSMKMNKSEDEFEDIWPK